MKSLPPHQRAQLREFISSLHSNFSIDQVFCFGWRMRPAEKVSCFSAELPEVPFSHYDLLLVTSIGEKWIPDIRQLIQDHPKKGFDVSVLVHTKTEATEALESGERFFASVFAEGIPIFSHDPFIVPEGRLAIDWVKAYKQASRCWKVRERSAMGLLVAAASCLEGRRYETVPFLLGQCLEQTCVGLIFTFLSYRAEMHDLSTLLSLFENFSDLPTDLFPRGSTEEQRRFELLQDPTADSHRESDEVSPQDAQLLFERVSEYVEYADKECRKKLGELSEKAGLPPPPDPLEELLRAADEESY